MTEPHPNVERFWNLAQEQLARVDVERGTIMGRDCLRTKGDFYAMIDERSGGLLVKLPADQVAKLIAAGRGEPFKPARHVFKEWLAVPTYERRRWARLLDEARDFVASRGRVD